MIYLQHLLDDDNVAIMAELLRGFPTDQRGEEERDHGLHNIMPTTERNKKKDSGEVLQRTLKSSRESLRN